MLNITVINFILFLIFGSFFSLCFTKNEIGKIKNPRSLKTLFFHYEMYSSDCVRRFFKAKKENYKNVLFISRNNTQKLTYYSNNFPNSKTSFPLLKLLKTKKNSFNRKFFITNNTLLSEMNNIFYHLLK